MLSQETLTEIVAREITPHGSIPYGVQSYPDLLSYQREFIGIVLKMDLIPLKKLPEIIGLSKPNIIYHKKVFNKRYSDDNSYREKIDKIIERLSVIKKQNEEQNEQ